jgi:hypothetical protein
VKWARRDPRQGSLKSQMNINVIPWIARRGPWCNITLRIPGGGYGLPRRREDRPDGSARRTGFSGVMPGIEAPLSEAAAACVHAYRVGSNAVTALVQADDLAAETVAMNMPDRQGAPELAPQTSRASANAVRASIGASDLR